MDTPQRRAETARALQHEAHTVLRTTGLLNLLTQNFSAPLITGSTGYDLMVWRDIDVHMPVAAGRWAEWMAFGGKLASQLDAVGLGLYHATYFNDYVDPDPLGPELYWGIEFNDFDRHRWKIDIWGWDPPDFDRRNARDQALRAQLKAADRDLILRLKTEARARENYYGVKVSSWDVYQFAIARAGDSLEALEQWKATR